MGQAKTMRISAKLVSEMAYFAIRYQKSLIEALASDGTHDETNFSAVVAAKKRLSSFECIYKKSLEAIKNGK